MNDQFANWWTNHSETILNIAYNFVLAVLVGLASFLVARAIRRGISRANERIERFEPTLVPILCSTATYLVYIVGVVIVLDVFGVNTASIITLLGAAGLAVGFALKDTLSNIAAGIMLLILKPFKVEDSIEFGANQGRVKEINLFSTILETFDGLYVSAPNSVLWGKTIKNFTRNDKRRMDVVVGISYGDSIDTGLEVLSKIVAAEPRLLQDPAPQTMVVAMADSSVNLQLRGWANTGDFWQTFWDLNKRVKEEVEKAGLTIPFPQRDVHIISGQEDSQ